MSQPPKPPPTSDSGDPSPSNSQAKRTLKRPRQPGAWRAMGVTLALAVMLGGSVAAAYLYAVANGPPPPVQLQPLRIGAMTLAAPQSWQTTETTLESPLVDSATTLVDPRFPERRLVLASLRPDDAALPRIKLTKFINAMKDNGETRYLPQRLRVGRVVGHALIGLGGERSRTVAVLTEEGTAHWLVMVESGGRPSRSRSLADAELVMSICARVSSHTTEPATRERSLVAGVDLQPPVGTEARVMRDSRAWVFLASNHADAGAGSAALSDKSSPESEAKGEGDSADPSSEAPLIEVGPMAAPFAMVRVMATVDPGVAAPITESGLLRQWKDLSPLHPIHMLRAHYRQTTSRDMQPDGVSYERLGGFAIWRIIPSRGRDTEAEGGLVRELAYARRLEAVEGVAGDVSGEGGVLGPGRGPAVLVEVLREREPRQREEMSITESRDWVREAVALVSAGRTTEPNGSYDSGQIDAMLVRGRRLAKRLTLHYCLVASMNSPVPAGDDNAQGDDARPADHSASVAPQRYFVGERGRRVAHGLVVFPATKHGQGQGAGKSHVLRGRSHFYLPNPRFVHTQVAQWVATPDLQAFSVSTTVTQRRRKNGKVLQHNQRLSMKDRTISYSEVIGGRRRPVVEAPLPDAYLAPMLGDYWPEDVFEQSDRYFPALVWEQGNGVPPRPVVIELNPPAGQGSSGSPDAASPKSTKGPASPDSREEGGEEAPETPEAPNTPAETPARRDVHGLTFRPLLGFHAQHWTIHMMAMPVMERPVDATQGCTAAGDGEADDPAAIDGTQGGAVLGQAVLPKRHGVVIGARWVSASTTRGVETRSRQVDRETLLTRMPDIEELLEQWEKDSPHD